MVDSAAGIGTVVVNISSKIVIIIIMFSLALIPAWRIDALRKKYNKWFTSVPFKTNFFCLLTLIYVIYIYIY